MAAAQLATRIRNSETELRNMYRLYCAEIKKAFNNDSKTAREQVALLERTSHNALRLLESLTDQKLGVDHAAWSAWWAGWNRTEPAIGPSPPGGGLIADTGIEASRLHRPRVAAGTKVWTSRGTRPIESLRTGDLVLSQDPATAR